MKAVYLIAVLIVVATSVRSQSILIIPEVLPQPATKINNLLSTDQRASKLIPGSVYILPQDHMPCLVPLLPDAAKMPVYYPHVENLYIPNPYFQKDLVSLTKNILHKNNLSGNLILDPFNKNKNDPKF